MSLFCITAIHAQEPDDGPEFSRIRDVAFGVNGGTYLYANEHETDVISSDGKELKREEAFALINLGGDKVAFKAYNGKFVRCTRWFGYWLVVDSDYAGDIFEVRPEPWDPCHPYQRYSANAGKGVD